VNKRWKVHWMWYSVRGKYSRYTYCLYYAYTLIFCRAVCFNVRTATTLPCPLSGWLRRTQWCIAKHGGGYTQKGVAYVYTVYPAYLWSLRWVYAVKQNPEVGVRRIYTTGRTAILNQRNEVKIRWVGDENSDVTLVRRALPMHLAQLRPAYEKYSYCKWP